MGWSFGNLNSDATIDSTDLGLLLNKFGHTSVAMAAGVSHASSDAPADFSPRLFAIDWLFASLDVGADDEDEDKI